MNDELRELFKGRRVLVTGGAGVIGTELIQMLVGLESRVLCCDLKPRPQYFPAGVEYIEGDANDLTSRQVDDFGPEACFHLAATFERSIETEEFWEENYWHNIRLSHHVMTLLKHSPTLQKVVFASSYLIYDPHLYLHPDPRKEPVVLREDSPVYPRNICGAAKYLHELELRFLTDFDTASYRAICARIFRVYGKNSRDIVSRWIRMLLADEEAHLPLYRKEGIFDYIYAGDVARGLLLLGACDTSGIVNLGSGRARSVAELVEVLRARFPNLRTREVEIDIPFEAHQADMTLFEETTGWRPDTSLEEGVDVLIDHERSIIENGIAAEDEDRFVGGVLITSSSSKVPLVRRMKAALCDLEPAARVWVADMNPDAGSRYFADGFWETPPLSELDPSELVEFCRDHDIGLILPTRDGELTYFAENRDLLAEAGVYVSVCAPGSVNLCLDKLAFYEKCRDGRLAAIPTFANLGALLDEMPEVERIVVKERHGAGSRTLGLGLDRSAAENHAAHLKEPVFQPEIGGVEHSVDLYVNLQGDVVDVVPRVRLQVRAGESVITETVEVPKLVQRSIDLASIFRLRGHNVLQAFVNPAGEPIFIECNPRVGGASALSMEAGLDSLRWVLMEARGVRVEPKLGSYRRGLRMVRYSCDRFVPS